MKYNLIASAALISMLAMSGMPVFADQVNTLTSSSTGTRPEVDTPTPAQDESITATIKSEINKSSVLGNLSVQVSTSKGVVTLTGNVNSDSEASELVQIAQSVIGVQDVDAGSLKVKDSTQPFADMLTTAKIKGLLIREDIFGTKDIASINMSIETRNGVVYLTGVVDNKQQIKNAIKLIEGVKGVKKVEYRVNKVSVDRPLSAK